MLPTFTNLPLACIHTVVKSFYYPISYELQLHYSIKALQAIIYRYPVGLSHTNTHPPQIMGKSTNSHTNLTHGKNKQDAHLHSSNNVLVCLLNIPTLEISNLCCKFTTTINWVWQIWTLLIYRQVKQFRSPILRLAWAYMYEEDTWIRKRQSQKMYICPTYLFTSFRNHLVL